MKTTNTISLFIIRTLLLAGCMLIPAAAYSGPVSSAVIDDCAYPSDAPAQAAWKAMEKSPAVSVAMLDGEHALRMRCNFSTNPGDRACWDQSVKLNLADCEGFEFKVYCRESLPVEYFTIYFQSGAGWYLYDFYPETAGGWNTINIPKTAMRSQGQPAGWDQIKTIRIAAWRGLKTDTEFYFSGLRRILPESGEPAVETALTHAGQIASFTNFDDALAQIKAQAEGNETVTKLLASAAALRDASRQLASQNKFSEANKQVSAAGEQLKQAFYHAQRPEPGEFRAFWCHSAWGVPGMSWDEAIHRLADNGFTAIIPNMLSAGVAYYPSKVLPVADAVAQRGDQISQCLAACRKYGIQMYVWKLDWNLNGAPKSFVDDMRAQHRLQISDKGKEELWLCPSHPDNRKLEIAALLEVVSNYDVDGIHFDYIRYPGVDYCFCDGCKARFQQGKGVTVQSWPADVLPGGPLRQQWLDWRRDNITTVVKAVNDQARALKPKIKLSAAVFRYWNVDRDLVGQDWKLWCEKGYLDFLCPMDYTASKLRFENMVSQQVQWAGKVPCYPGLGASSSSSHFGADRAIEEIAVTRRYHTGGFIIFNYGANETKELLPELGAGMTRP